jgi:CDP-glucose 4,6-dehydratase
MKLFKKIYKGKKVLITGHTGFKGSWLSLWFSILGANVLGISSSIPTKPSHFELLKLNKKIKSKKINIQNFKLIKKTIVHFKPDFIFHLAAQSIVKKSYIDPVETWKTNLLGTMNILEAIKVLKNNKKLVVVLITSDKAYKNLEIKKGYKEDSFLGGIDPYGGSKSAAEICIQSYIKSFFKDKNNKISIGIARAGNVIGGGDWSDYRLLPDCIKAWTKNKKVKIRNPNSTRPWQHVLDVLNGYIMLGAKLNKNKKLHGEAFNFGPSNSKNLRVLDILKISKSIWPEINWIIENKKNFFENNLLQLNSNKAKKILNWKCNLSSKDSIQMTIDWYKNYVLKRNVYNLSRKQILDFKER